MGQGILGWFHNNVSGGQSRQTPSPGLFAPGQVGAYYGDYLKDLYRTPTDQTAQYRTQSTALRDALAQETEGQKDEFATATNAGGFYDSGARLTGLNEINRNKMMAYSQGLAAILGRLEEQKMQAAFPYLQSVLGEYNAHQGAIAAAQGEQNFRGAQIGAGISGAFSGGGGGAGSSLTGNSS